MKKIIMLSLLSFLSFIGPAQAISPTSIDDLVKQGMVVKMGELTGAGSKYSVRNLVGLILPEGVLMKEDCRSIIVKNNVDPKISDIVKVQIQNQEINSSEFIGFVLK